MKRRTILIFLLIAAKIFSFMGDENAVARFVTASLVKNEDSSYILTVSYSIEPGARVYLKSDLELPLELKFSEGREIMRADFPHKKLHGAKEYIEGDGTIVIIFKGDPEGAGLSVRWQGCSAEKGVCYIPEETIVSLVPGKLVARTAKPKPEQKPVQRTDKKLKGIIERNIDRPLLAVLFVFIAGFLTSLTPCVYPMIPITISYFGGTAEGMKKNFVKSLFYVLGLSITYTFMGLIAGITGTAFGSLTQNPYVLFVFTALFFIMALMMSDYIALPGFSAFSSSHSKIAAKRTDLSAFLLGLITGLVASPCVGPVVLFLLTLIVSKGSILYGTMLMFFFSLGLGVIFVILGTFSGLIEKIPRAGTWMEKVKTVFSVLMAAASAYFLNTALKGLIGIKSAYFAWAFFIFTSLFFLDFYDLKRFQPEATPQGRKKSIASFIMLLAFICGSGLFLKGIIHNGTRPAVSERALKWHKDLESGLAEAERTGKFIFLDFTATWCVMCREFEHAAEKDSELASALSRFVLIRLDYDKNKDLAKELFDVRALPAFIFLNDKGEIIERESGFSDMKGFKADFLKTAEKYITR